MINDVDTKLKNFCLALSDFFGLDILTVELNREGSTINGDTLSSCFLFNHLARKRYWANNINILSS